MGETGDRRNVRHEAAANLNVHLHSVSPAIMLDGFSLHAGVLYRRKPPRAGALVLSLSPDEFLARLAPPVPPPRATH